MTPAWSLTSPSISLSFCINILSFSVNQHEHCIHQSTYLTLYISRNILYNYHNLYHYIYIYYISLFIQHIIIGWSHWKLISSSEHEDEPLKRRTRRGQPMTWKRAAMEAMEAPYMDQPLYPLYMNHSVTTSITYIYI